jgi:hypothetical protein
MRGVSQDVTGERFKKEEKKLRVYFTLSHYNVKKVIENLENFLLFYIY